MVRARVINGRILVDEPTTLPDGTVLDLVVDDDGDDLDDAEREALHRAISRGAESAKSGKVRLASDVIDELRPRR